MKICTKCDVQKEVKEFTKDSRYSDGRHSWCKGCKNLSAKKHRATYTAWVANNKQKVDAIKQRYVDCNQDKVKASKQRWSKSNPKSELAKCRRYQAAKLKAIPEWITEEQLSGIKLFYKNCPKDHEVDHIVPLQGKDVRGLHVPWNLQYLPVSANRKKSNKLAA